MSPERERESPRKPQRTTCAPQATEDPPQSTQTNEPLSFCLPGGQVKTLEVRNRNNRLRHLIYLRPEIRDIIPSGRRGIRRISVSSTSEQETRAHGREINESQGSLGKTGKQVRRVTRTRATTALTWLPASDEL